MKTSPRSLKKNVAKSPKTPQGVKYTDEFFVKKLRSEFKEDTIDVSPGYKDNLHLVVVSRKFDRMSEAARLSFIKEILKSEGVPEDAIDRFSLVIALSPSELK